MSRAHGWLMDPRVRRRVIERDRSTCQYCGRVPSSAELHVDHVIPRSMGGDDSLSNLAAACASCNIGFGNGPKPIPRRLRNRLYRCPIVVDLRQQGARNRLARISAYWWLCGYRRSPMVVFRG